MGKRVAILLSILLFSIVSVVSVSGTGADNQSGFDTLEDAVEVEALKVLGYTPDSDLSLQYFRQQDNWVYGAYVYPALDVPDSNITQAESSIFIAYEEGGEWFAAHSQTESFSDIALQAPENFLSDEEVRILSPVDSRSTLSPESVEADGSSQLALPWDPYSSGWRLNQGPHSYYGGYGHSSLDLNGPSGVHMTVRAARGGIAYQVDCATPSTLVHVVHADGWKTSYLHLEDIQVPAYTSYPVERWQWLGNTGFVGRDGCGRSDGVHLHFTLWKNDAEYNLDNVAIGGYVIDTGTDCMTHPVFGQKCQWDELPNDGTIGEYPQACTTSRLPGVYSTSEVCEDVRIYDQANSGGNVTWQGNIGFSNGPGGNDLQYRLEIAAGMSVKTWRGDNRTGEERCWSQSVPNLQDHGWQNDIESIEVFGSNVCPVTPPTQCGPDVGPDIQLFEHANCDGSSYIFPDAGFYNLDNFNDTTSAVHVPSGKSVALFEHNDGNGQNRCIPENADLWDMSLDYWPNGTSMNDSVSSIRVFNSPDCGPYLETTAPNGWCQGGVGWTHRPYDIPQDPSCLSGDYASDIDGNIIRHSTFQAMTDRVEGVWGGMWFEPKCDAAYVSFGSVTIFDNTSCSGSYTHYQTGTHDVSGEELRSLFIPLGKSVALIKNDGLQAFCRGEDASLWDTYQDYWPDGSDVYGTIGSIKVFDSPDCEPYIETTAPANWCHGGVGWKHTPYDIPQDPGCLFGEYASDKDGTVTKYSTFQDMVTQLEGEWAGMWFEPKCTSQHVPLDHVAFFDNVSCSGNYDEYVAGTYNVSEEVISVFIPMGRSIALIKDDGSQTFCRGEDQSLWNLQEDYWPDSSDVYGTLGEIIVFDAPDCEPYVQTTAPSNWCEGGVGWEHQPYDIPQDPECLYGEYASDRDGVVVRYSTFQEMVSHLEGKWAGMWFEPKCSAEFVQLNHVSVFDGRNCSGSYKQLTTGTHDMTGVDVHSLFIPFGKSVTLVKNGGSQFFCRGENASLWNTENDHWPDGSGVYGTIGSLRVYNNPSCSAGMSHKIFMPLVTR